MKIIRQLTDGRLIIYADSAITLPGRPIVVTEQPRPTEVTLAPALRVSRLGKGISQRFASRYVDAVALAAILSSPGDDTLCFADNTITLSEWRSIGADADINAITIPLLQATLSTIGITEMIEAVSRIATLKNGDILIPPSSVTIPLPSERLSVATTDGSPIMNRRII